MQPAPPYCYSHFCVFGRLKVAHKLSFADCFAVTLAQHAGGQLITSDHHELDPLAAAGFPITFFR
ncbi:MAG: hypothetical protein HOP19_07245 [Acidobacteria bacterium]|nr:hypothetical protein [Acidobacteriota bacterium]